MFSSLCNRKGISLVEVLIALFLITTGVLSLLTLQPSAWRTAGRSDLLGRATGILHRELETQEMLLMNPGLASPCAPPSPNPMVIIQAVNASNRAQLPLGDMTFNMVTTIRDNLNNTFTVRVTVSWPGSAGISETIFVRRQEACRF